jgi:phosphoglucosamine mutase
MNLHGLRVIMGKPALSMKKLFGTDGIRAQAGEFPLDSGTVRVIGASLGKHYAEKLGRQPRFVTGRDTRESGEWIEKAIHEGALGAGAEIESASVITTPGVAFVTGCFGFDAGIVISASHNPFEDNGIKVFLPDGRKLDDVTERQIESDIHEHLELQSGSISSLGVDRSETFRNAYLAHLAEFFPDLNLNGIRIIADCANGASSGLAPELFEKFGATVETINCSPDGRNINKDCGSLHLEHLQKSVVDSNADVGVAFDGDADRALFTDEKGNIVDGDAALWILAGRLQDEDRLTNSQVVATVMSNLGLELALKSRKIELVRTAVGDKYVLDELLRGGASIGGEQSGHIIFPHESLVGDGMLTALSLLDALSAKKQKLSEAAAGFVRYPQVLVNVRVREKLPFESVPAIDTAAKSIEQELDGTGRLLLRYSGTENLARVMIEGRDQMEIEQLAGRLADIMKAELG